MKFVPSNTSILERILLELDKRALPGMDRLSPSEKSLALKAVLVKYMRSDDEKERQRLEKDIECSRESISSGFKVLPTFISFHII